MPLLPQSRDHRASSSSSLLGRLNTGRGLFSGLGSNYVRDSGEIMPKADPGAPAWMRAQQQVYGPSLPGGVGSDLGATVGVYGILAVAGIIWLISKAK